MKDIISATADDIRSMRVRGAGRIARAGANALADYAESYQGSDLGSFREDISKAADILLGSRPTAVSLWNGVHATIRDVDSASDLAGARQSVIDNGRRFAEDSEKAVEAIAKFGAKRIKDGDVLMTHCNSSAAIGVIAEAIRQGKDVKVYATESRPWRQGILTVRDLKNAGAEDVTLIIDSAVRTVMQKVDRVFVGADTVTSSGTLINKIGTSQVAMAAAEARAEFNVCAETYKFSPKTLFGDAVTIEERDIGEIVRPGEIPEGVKVFNPVFDTTPAKYIDNIITEIGIMSPGSVYGVMAEQLGGALRKQRCRQRRNDRSIKRCQNGILQILQLSRPRGRTRPRRVCVRDLPCDHGPPDGEGGRSSGRRAVDRDLDGAVHPQRRRLREIRRQGDLHRGGQDRHRLPRG